MPCTLALLAALLALSATTQELSPCVNSVKKGSAGCDHAQGHNDIQEHINHIQERNQEGSSRLRKKAEAVMQGAYKNIAVTIKVLQQMKFLA